MAKNSDSKELISIQEKLIKELYGAGMGVFEISNILNVASAIVKKVTEGVPQGKRDDSLINRILYDKNQPLAEVAIYESEKERFVEYARIESQCLKLMQKLLGYYVSQPVGADLMQDAFKSKIVKDFLQVTQSARDSLISKLGDTHNAQESKALNISLSFIDKDKDKGGTS